ncbi:hypothetical protein HAX54_028413 [Datura stramonium]|uniref:Uncharacterized protein n=1 Tax=Datura stramonium TaxID=4076 RepID=A0ABS8V4H1_DATST|nr:hypothetical protein [Datura stramonium]
MGESARDRRAAGPEMWVAEDKGAQSRKLNVELKNWQATGELENPIRGLPVYRRPEAEYLKLSPKFGGLPAGRSLNSSKAGASPDGTRSLGTIQVEMKSNGEPPVAPHFSREKRDTTCDNS